MHGSDEEVDDPPEVDSDEDLTDDGRKQIHEEVGCSRFRIICASSYLLCGLLPELHVDISAFKKTG